MNFSFEDILEQLARQAIDTAAERLRTSTEGLRTCPRDGALLTRMPRGDDVCSECGTKWAAKDPEPQGFSFGLGGFGFRIHVRTAPFSATNSTTNPDAFRPPFSRRSRGDGFLPPRPFARQRRYPQPPPPVLREDEVAAAYKLLELPPSATANDVKTRRRTLALKHHPDHGGDGKALARINAAADLLLKIL